jgi:hypothetical protein
MLARLGSVLYWFGCGAALIVLAFGGLVAYEERNFAWSSTPATLVVFLVLAGLVWLAGRACRYVLAGR